MIHPVSKMSHYFDLCEFLDTTVSYKILVRALLVDLTNILSLESFNYRYFDITASTKWRVVMFLYFYVSSSSLFTTNAKNGCRFQCQILLMVGLGQKFDKHTLLFLKRVVFLQVILPHCCSCFQQK